jgi:hypothetical protein
VEWEGRLSPYVTDIINFWPNSGIILQRNIRCFAPFSLKFYSIKNNHELWKYEM